MAGTELPVLTQRDVRVPSTCVHFHPTTKSLEHTGVHRNEGYELHKDISCYSVCLNPVMADPEQPDRVANCQCPTSQGDCMEYRPSASDVLGYVSLREGDALALTRRNVLNGLEVYEVLRFADGAFGDNGEVLNPNIIFSMSVHADEENAYDLAVQALKDQTEEAGAKERDITWKEEEEQDTKSSYFEMVTSS